MTSFEKMIQTLPKDECSLRDRSCYFGVPPEQNRNSFDQLPEDVDTFYFYNLQKETLPLVQVFSTSRYTEQVTSLYIGNSSYCVGRMDFRDAIQILSSGYYPRLKTIKLGIWDDFWNTGVCYYGNLGDLAPLLKKMPMLKSLSISGYFELSQSLSLEKLEECIIFHDSQLTANDLNILPMLSQSDLNELLSSDFPKLKSLEIYLEDKAENGIYSLPKVLLQGASSPQLSLLILEGDFLDEHLNY